MNEKLKKAFHIKRQKNAFLKLKKKLKMFWSQIIT